MTDLTDTRDRVIRLESQVQHLTEAVEKMTDEVAKLTNLLNQAKGAKWVIVGAASLGGFIAGKIGLLAPWISGVPK